MRFFMKVRILDKKYVDNRRYLNCILYKY